MLIRPCQYIHTALLIYPYGPGKIFIRPRHTDQLDYLIKVLRTGCFCIGPGIDSRSAVFAIGPKGLGANSAHLESIPGPIQKQPVSNTIILSSCVLASTLSIQHLDIRGKTGCFGMRICPRRTTCLHDDCYFSIMSQHYKIQLSVLVQYNANINIIQ
jgi:hypothetical protein